MRWVIRLVERNGSLRPFQVIGCRRSDHVHFSVDDFQSTLVFNINKKYQSGIHVRITIIIFPFTLSLVCLLLLFLGLFLSELLDQEPTLSSGMLRVNEITFFVFFGVDMARQIQHVISILIFYFLGFHGPLGFPLNFP